MVVGNSISRRGPKFDGVLIVIGYWFCITKTPVLRNDVSSIFLVGGNRSADDAIDSHDGRGVHIRRNRSFANPRIRYGINDGAIPKAKWDHPWGRQRCRRGNV